MTNNFHNISLIRLIVLLIFFSVADIASAASFSGSSVPGGVSMVDLGFSSSPKPRARYGSKNILVIEQDGQWKGLVGVSLKTLPGNYIVSYQIGKDSTTNKEVPIKITPKTYPEQRIKMKAYGQIIQDLAGYGCFSRPVLAGRRPTQQPIWPSALFQ